MTAEKIPRFWGAKKMNNLAFDLLWTDFGTIRINRCVEPLVQHKVISTEKEIKN